jgi:hypothetical protein
MKGIFSPLTLSLSKGRENILLWFDRLARNGFRTTSLNSGNIDNFVLE